MMSLHPQYTAVITFSEFLPSKLQVNMQHNGADWTENFYIIGYTLALYNVL